MAGEQLALPPRLGGLIRNTHLEWREPLCPQHVAGGVLRHRIDASLPEFSLRPVGTVAKRRHRTPERTCNLCGELDCEPKQAFHSKVRRMVSSKVRVGRRLLRGT